MLFLHGNSMQQEGGNRSQLIILENLAQFRLSNDRELSNSAFWSLSRISG